MHFPPQTSWIPTRDPGRVLVVGSVNLDVGYTLDRLPRAGETVQATGRFVAGGGKGANQAMAARSLGADVALLACVGPDVAAALTDLDDHGVDLNGLVRQDRVGTGNAVLLSASDDNSIIIDAGANGLLDATHVRAYAERNPAPRVVVTNNEVPAGAVEEAIRSYVGRSTVIYNPSPTRKIAADLLEHVDLLVLNHAEAMALYGLSEGLSSAEAVMASLEQSAVGDTIVTLGAAGVVVCVAGSSIFIPAFRVDPIDTVGAGDAFLGALAAHLASGHSVLTAALYAAAAAAITVTAAGARAAPLSPSAVDALVQQRASTAADSTCDASSISERRRG